MQMDLQKIYKMTDPVLKADWPLCTGLSFLVWETFKCFLNLFLVLAPIKGMLYKKTTVVQLSELSA